MSAVPVCGCPIYTGGVAHNPTCWMNPANQPFIQCATTRRPFACPVCNGSGLVSRPPWIAGDQESWVSSGTTPHPCKACKGTGIVWSEA